MFSLLGYSPEEIRTAGFIEEILHPEDYTLILAMTERQATLTDQEVMELEYRMKHANGEWRWMMGREVVFIRNQDGSPRQVLGIAQDVTERKNMELAIKQRNQELAVLNTIISSILGGSGLAKGLPGSIERG